MHAARVLLLFGLLGLVAGCGPRQYSARGKVVYADGSPVSGGLVVFEKTDGNVTHTCDSPVNEDGTFDLRTKTPGDGVLPGKYRVLVRAKARSIHEKKRSPPNVDPKYEKFETSGIELVVEPKANHFEIKVAKP
jgi:hypothetical protein